MDITGKAKKIVGLAIILGVLGVVLGAYLSVRTSRKIQNKAISLFYYNPIKDLIPGSANLACSSAGLQAVPRTIPRSDHEMADAIKLLIQGGLSADEKKNNLKTEFPLPGLKLTGVSSEGSVLTLTFDDPQNSTGGGACRASVLWAQIEATAKQFPGVSEVKFSPSTLFQP